MLKSKKPIVYGEIMELACGCVLQVWEGNKVTVARSCREMSKVDLGSRKFIVLSPSHTVPQQGWYWWERHLADVCPDYEFYYKIL